MPSYKEDTEIYEKKRRSRLSEQDRLIEIKERLRRITGPSFLMPSDVYVEDVKFLLKRISK